MPSNTKQGGGDVSKPLSPRRLRFLVSPEEYAALRKHGMLQRIPYLGQRTHPEAQDHVQDWNDFLPSTVRVSTRLFALTQSALSAYDLVLLLLFRRGQRPRVRRHALHLSPNTRLALSLATLMALHRLLYRFLTTLRLNLRLKSAVPFRRRNPRIARLLTARLMPVFGASFAALALRLFPRGDFRRTSAIFAATRTAEFGFNAIDQQGYTSSLPWWFGSWLLAPFALAQLLHAYGFNRDCFPKAFGDFILKKTPVYVQQRPSGYPSRLPWPSNEQIVESLAEISRLGHPAFVSPILFPDVRATLPASLAVISPVTSPANPAIAELSCALLHPHEPSCTRTFLHYFLSAFTAFVRFFALFFSLFAFPRWRIILQQPVTEIYRLALRVLRTTIFATGAVGTGWASFCMFGSFLPRTLFPTQRWLLGGFLAGLWAFADRWHGRARFLYCTRLSIDSTWKVGVKKGWWRHGQNRDVWLVVVSLIAMSSLHEVQPQAIDSKLFRRGLDLLKAKDVSTGHERAGSKVRSGEEKVS